VIRLVKLAITACPECLTSYDSDEWRGLELLDDAPEPMSEGAELEARACAECGARCVALLALVDELDTWQDAGEYAARFPATDRVRLRSVVVRPSLRSRLAAVDWPAVALAFVLALAALAVATIMVRRIWGA
jgi:hypothetical protein